MFSPRYIYIYIGRNHKVVAIRKNQHTPQMLTRTRGYGQIRSSMIIPKLMVHWPIVAGIQTLGYSGHLGSSRVIEFMANLRIFRSEVSRFCGCCRFPSHVGISSRPITFRNLFQTWSLMNWTCVVAPVFFVVWGVSPECALELGSNSGRKRCEFRGGTSLIFVDSDWFLEPLTAM